VRLRLRPSLSLPFSLILSLARALSHTHTHSQTHTLSHTRSLSHSLTLSRAREEAGTEILHEKVEVVALLLRQDVVELPLSLHQLSRPLLLLLLRGTEEVVCVRGRC